MCHASLLFFPARLQVLSGLRWASEQDAREAVQTAWKQSHTHFHEVFWAEARRLWQGAGPQFKNGRRELVEMPWPPARKVPWDSLANRQCATCLRGLCRAAVREAYQ